MSERVLPRNKTELLEEIEREWHALQKVVVKLSPEEMVAPGQGGWSPKDNLAHLTEWMKILLGYHLNGRPDYEVIGVSPEVTRDWDYQKINQVLFERNRQRSVESVEDELKLVYAEVVGRLESIPFDNLLKPRFTDDPENRPVLNYVLGNTSEHFAEHRENIEKGV